MTDVAIIGSGNIGTDLMVKICERSTALNCVALVGIDPKSEGLARARDRGIRAIDSGIDGLIADPVFDTVSVVFDATSAGAHAKHDRLMREHERALVDLTPAAIGPYVVPIANIDAHLDAPNVNLVTCGGQATIPIVWAVGEVVDDIYYAEIVASISSRSAGPGTRANIDEFTETTSRGIEVVGGAKKGKAIIILNPAEPPMLMRDTVYVFCGADSSEHAKIETKIRETVAAVAEYVPGYRMVQAPVFETVSDVFIPGEGTFSGTKISVFLEVEGAGDFLPSYAGNLDIMTSAALRVGEKIAERA